MAINQVQTKMKIILLGILIFSCSIVFGSKKHKAPAWINYGGGVHYKGIFGVQGNVYGRLDLITLNDRNVRFSVFNRTGLGIGLFGYIWQANTNIMAQIRLNDNNWRHWGFSYAFGYSAHLTSAEKNPQLLKFFGLGTHQFGLKSKDDAEYFISIQVNKYFIQTIMSLEMGVTFTLNRRNND
jgi:hypothetical protein